MAEVEGLLVRIEANTAALRQQLAQAEARVDQATRRMDQSLATVDRAFQRVGDAIGKVQVILAGAGIAAGLADTAKAARDFETAMAQVSTLLKDTSGLARYAAQLKDLSKQFGELPVDEAKALYEVLSAGGYSAANAMDVLTQSNKLAIGGVTDVQTAADGLTSTMNAYGAAAGKASDVADAFFAAAAAGKTNIKDLASYIGQVSPIAAQTGVSLDQLLAAVAALTAGGIKTSTAMDGMRNVIAQVIKPSDEAVKVAKALGLQFNAAALQSKGLSGFLADVAAKTGGSSEMMAKLFGGVEALLPVMALTGTAAKDFAGALDDMKTKAGAADTAYGKMADTSEQAMKRLTAQVVIYQTEVGTRLLAVTGPALAGLSKNFDTVTTAVEGLAYGLTITLAARAVPVAIGALRALNLAMLSNAITALPALVAMAVGALIAFRDDITPLTDSLTTLGDYGRAAWVMITDAATATNAVLGDMHIRMNGLGPAAELAGGTVFRSLELLNSAVIVLMNSVKAWGNLFINTFVAIGALPAGVGEKIVTAFRQAFSTAADLASAFWRGLESTFSGDFSFSAFNTALQGDLLAPFRATVGDIGTDLGAIFSQDRIGAAMGAAGAAVVQFGQTWKKTAEDIRAQQLFDEGQNFRSPDLPTPPKPPENKPPTPPGTGVDIAKMADWRNEILLSIAASERLALATAKGAAAVEAATRQQEIEKQVLKLGAGARAEVTRLVNAEADARQKLALAQFIADIERETAAMTGLADAEQKGVAAVEEANIQGKVAVELARQRIAAGTAEAKVIENKVRVLDAETKRRQQNAAIRSSQEDLAYAKAELSLMDQAEPLRARALTSLRIQREAMNNVALTTDAARQEWISYQEQIADVQAVKDYQQTVRDTAKGIASDWTETLYDALILKDKATSIIDGVKALGKRIALALLETNIVLPITTTIVGAVPGLFGITSPAGAAAGQTAAGQNAAGGVSLSNVASAAQSGYSVLTGSAGTTAANAATWVVNSQLGQALGWSGAGVSGTAGAGTAGAAASGYTAAIAPTTQGAGIINAAGTLGSVAPYGFLGGMAGAAISNNFMGGSKIGGAVTGAVAGTGALAAGTMMTGGYAALAAIPVYGWIAAAVLAAVTAALGSNAPTVGPNAAGNLYIDSSGAKSGPSAGDNGMDGSGMQSITDAASQAINVIVGGIGAGFQKGMAEQNFGHITYFQEGNKWALQNMQGGDSVGEKQLFASQEELVQGLIRQTLKRLDAGGQVTGFNADVRTALTNSKATKAEDLASDITFAAGFRDQLALMNDSLDPTNNLIKTFTENAKKVGEQVKTNIIDWHDQALELGLATEAQLVPAMKKGLLAMMGLGPAAEPLIGLAAVTKEAEINVQAFTPALAALGYSATEQAALVSQYVEKAKQSYRDAVAYTQRQGAAAIEGLTDPTARTSVSDRLRGAGLDPANKAVQGLATVIGNVEAAARAGTLTMRDERWALGQLDAQLAAGQLTADQYGTAVGMLTQAWTDSAAAAQKAAEKVQASEDLTVRALRGMGLTDQADDYARGLQHARDYQTAVTAGFDATYLAGLKFVQWLENVAATAERAAKVDNARADIFTRAVAASGNSVWAASLRFDTDAAQQRQTAWNNGLRGQDLANLDTVLAAERGQTVFEAAQSAYMTEVERQIQAINDNTQSARDVVSANSQFVQSVRQAAKDRLLNDSISPLSAKERLDEATRQVNDVYAKALNGDETARGQIVALLNTRDELSRGYNESTNFTDFWDSQAKLEALGLTASDQLDSAQQTVKIADAQLKELQKARTDAQNLGQRQLFSLDSLHATMQSAYNDWTVALNGLAPLLGQTGKPVAPDKGGTTAAQQAAQAMTQWFSQYDAYRAKYNAGQLTPQQYQEEGAALFQGKVNMANTLPLDPIIWNAFIGAAAAGSDDGRTAAWLRQVAHDKGVPGFAAGGIIPHIPGVSIPGVDSVPLIGMPGEGVVNLRGMGVLGADGLAALNAGRWPANDRWSGNVTAFRSAGSSAGTASLEQRLDRAVSVLERILAATEAGDADNAAATGEAVTAIAKLTRQIGRAAGPAGSRLRTANG